MRRIQIDGHDLPPTDPLRDLIELALEIQSRERYITVESIFEAGLLVRLRKIESVKVSKPN